jgi:hypothetical protein
MMTAFNTPGLEINADAPSFKVMVLAAGETEFVSNGLRFSTVDGASEYASDLAGRWTAVKSWYVVDTDEEPNRD